MTSASAFRLLLVLTVACTSAVPTSNTTPVVLQPQASETPVRVSAAGDTAALTLAVRPHAGSELAQALRVLVPSMAALTDQIESGALFDEWLAGVTRGSRQGVVPGVLSWPGLDPSRPIYIRIGEAPDNLNAALEAIELQSAQSSYRHVLALPVTDAGALREALSPFVAGCSHQSAGYRCEMGRVDFVDHADWLFVVLHPFGAPERIEGRSLMGELNGSESWALHGDSPLAGLMRVAPIRSASVHHSAGLVRGALGSASGGYVNQMQVAGTAEIIGAFVQAARYGRELDTWAFAVQSDPLSLAVAGALSEVGAERYRASSAATPAVEGSGVSSAPTASAPIIVRSSLDLPALIDVTPSPLAYQRFGEHDEARHAFRSCGIGCGIRGLFEPAAYLSMASEDGPVTELLDHVRFEVQAGLPSGTVDADVDLTQIVPPLVPAGTQLFIRSRVDGGLWAGGVALSVQGAEHGLAHAGSHASVSAQRSQGDGDPASLQCLLALGSDVEAGLQELVRMEGGFAAAIERIRAELAERAGCVTDPSHAAERDGYLQAYEAGVAPLAGVTL